MNDFFISREEIELFRAQNDNDAVNSVVEFLALAIRDDVLVSLRGEEVNGDPEWISLNFSVKDDEEYQNYLDSGGIWTYRCPWETAEDLGLADAVEEKLEQWEDQ